MFIASAVCAQAAHNWCAYNHDHAATAVTKQALQTPLHEAWRFQSRHRPRPAWPEPAKQDYYHRLSPLHPAVTFDRAFHTVVKGSRLCFGSSADDTLYCLDTRTGRLLWSFAAEAPIRLAPTIYADRVYFGADDGIAYCLDLQTGECLWRCRPVDDDYRLPGNGRIMSLWPIRTGILLDGDTAWFCAGLFPTEGVFLCAVSTEDGTLRMRREISISPQGYMLASPRHIFIPTGRTQPAIFDKSDGKHMGNLPGPGGAFALLVEDTLTTGPGRGTGAVAVTDLEQKTTIATFDALRMVVRGDIAYIQTAHDLSALDRTRYLDLARRIQTLTDRRKDAEKKLKSFEKGEQDTGYIFAAEEHRQLTESIAELNEEARRCTLWRVAAKYPYSLILADDILFAGGENGVAAFDAAEGKLLWQKEVSGKAWSLAAADDRLFVSTDHGVIHCFQNEHRPLAVITLPGNDDSYFRDHSSRQTLADAAERILLDTNIAQGYCVVVDPASGTLAYELAKLSDLQIVCIEKSDKAAETLRQRFHAAGLAERIVVHCIPGEQLPYPDYFANLIVSEAAAVSGKLPANAKELLRLLRPEGGTLCLGASSPSPRALTETTLKEWALLTGVQDPQINSRHGIWLSIRRAALAGAGAWTHQYADTGNTACSSDALAAGPMRLQWFGEPGPRDVIDRHHRAAAPLVAKGRLFVPGDNLVWCLDAANGTIYWQRSLPETRRVGIFLDCGSMCVDDTHLYVAAADQCLKIDVDTGSESAAVAMPQLADAVRHWGYLARTGGLLFGSGRKPDAAYSETSYEADLALWYRNMKVVTSDYLFALDPTTGQPKWTHIDKDGVILNPTIAIGGGRFFFVQTTSPSALNDQLGRLPVKDLFKGGTQSLAALDASTGDLLYKIDLDVSKIAEPVSLNCADGVVIFSGSSLVKDHIRYYYTAFEAATGRILWQTDHNSELPTDGGHGEYNRHLTIVDQTVYAWPYAYNLKDGRRIEGWKFNRRGHGCGGVSASANALFWRGHNPWIYDLTPGGGPVRLNTVTRPGCWINIIPAAGLVLIPEASSGCTCGYPLQTSLAYRPLARN